MLFSLLVLLLSFQGFSFSEDSCMSNSCICKKQNVLENDLQVTCSGLKQLPFFNQAISFAQIEIKDSCIFELRYESFPGRRINRLILKDIGITYVEYGFINDGNSTMVHLELDNNGIIGLNGSVFYLTNLKTLSISGNKIQILSERMMDNGNKLTKLNISHNELSEISLDAFEGLINLEFLDVSFNKLKSIGEEVTNGLHKLITLDMSHNSINTLGLDTFNGMLTLKSIDLSHNLIEILPTQLFNSLKKLEHLDLSHNQFVRISKDLLADTGSLRFLSLAYNALQTFPSENLLSCTHLEHLDLSGNQLTDVPDIPRELETLKTLNLNRNNIKQIQHGIFHKETPLWNLYLRQNQIVSVKNVFENLTQLEVLDLGENQIVQVTANDFSGIQFLKEIYLDNNYIEEYPERLENEFHQNEIKIDISNNKLKDINNIVLYHYFHKFHLNFSGNEIKNSPVISLNAITEYLILDLSHNKLIDLPTILIDIGFFVDFNINLAHNEIRNASEPIFVIHEDRFWDVAVTLDISDNPLSTLPATFLEIKHDNKLEVDLYAARIGLSSVPRMLSGCFIVDFDLSGNTIKQLTPFTVEEFRDIQRMNLSHNQIGQIEEETFVNMQLLQVLDLSSNELIHIQEKIWAGMFSLEKLNLANNRLLHITGSMFKQIPQLQVLNLQNNEITTIKQSVLDSLTLLHDLLLAGNPFHCDCSVSWLRNSFAVYKDRWQMICHTNYRGMFAVCYPTEECHVKHEIKCTESVCNSSPKPEIPTFKPAKPLPPVEVIKKEDEISKIIPIAVISAMSLLAIVVFMAIVVIIWRKNRVKQADPGPPPAMAPQSLHELSEARQQAQACRLSTPKSKERKMSAAKENEGFFDESKVEDEHLDNEDNEANERYVKHNFMRDKQASCSLPFAGSSRYDYDDDPYETLDSAHYEDIDGYQPTKDVTTASTYQLDIDSIGDFDSVIFQPAKGRLEDADSTFDAVSYRHPKGRLEDADSTFDAVSYRHPKGEVRKMIHRMESIKK